MGCRPTAWSSIGLRRDRTPSSGRSGGPFDLVLLDLVLPQLNGLAVLERLQEAKPELPVIVVSARGDMATKLKAFELGARDYVEKPFSFDELLARIRVHLNGRLGANVVRAGSLELDLTTREASVGSIRALLSDREFRLLGYLVEHAGQAVSRERLLSEVWGYGFDPGSNVVDVCIRRIRRRLGPEAPIETIRNVGYRLAVD